CILILLSWLFPIHAVPWTTFHSELLAFLSGLSLVAGLSYSEIKIPKPQILALPILFIPLIQWGFGQILYFSNALLCTIYIAMFWLMVVVGYNLAIGEKRKREKVFKIFCFVVYVGAIISRISEYFSPWLNVLRGNRPYANFAQPNNLATFICIGLFACLYFYEKKIISNMILISTTFIFLLTIALTQSRTAWVVCIFTFFYLMIKHFGKNRRFGFVKLLAWVGIFITLIVCLPIFNQWLVSFASQDIIQTATVAQRASSGYLRLDIWNQALVAITQQPWFGYGWNQTGIAQISAFDSYPSHEWYNTAHNVILDLLIWNGIPISTIIVFFMIIWLFWLNCSVKEPVSIAASLMVFAILIHALLEYPIHYAYFLLPLGFLLGIIQAQYIDLSSLTLNKILLPISLFGGVILIIIINRDYELYRKQSLIVTRGFALNDEERESFTKKIIVLDQLRERVWWIGFNPHSKVSDQQLEHIGRMVSNLASRYDIYKYAQVLAFNGKKAEAEHQLWVLKILHGQEKSYQDLLPISIAEK
ncbi:unnamed protein product, partial [Oppiella nova]